MVPLAQAATAPEVSRAQLVQAGHEVDAQGLQQRQHEPPAVVAIAEHDVAARQRIEQGSQQRRLTGLLARIGATGQPHDHPRGQRTEGDGTQDREAESFGLRRGLGVLGLILSRVGHRKGRTVDHPHVAPLPAPGRRDARFAVACDLERQSPRHAFGHLGPRAAVSAGVGATDLATEQRVERRHAHHRGQTGALFGGKEHLGEHRPQRHRRCVDGLVIVVAEVDVFGVEGALDLFGRERIGERQAGGLQQRWRTRSKPRCKPTCDVRKDMRPTLVQLGSPDQGGSH